jgi:glycosyltransferase involved in cell wall biosynthesis
MTKFNFLVVALVDKGVVGSQIEELGVEIVELNLSRKTPITFKLLKLIFILKYFKPDVIQGWMYHANLLAYMSSIFFFRAKLYWSVRHTLYNIRNEKLITRFVIRSCKLLSGRCDKIIYNSRKSLQQHVEFGYSKNNSIVIHNGFDVDKYSPLNYRNTRDKYKSELGVSRDAIIIGIVARFHPMKGYEDFINAALLVLEKYPNTHFIAVGKNITDSQFEHLLADNYLSSFHFLGERSDIPEIISTFDISVNSSKWGEAFSNSICESMAMEVPCVVTNVGDSEYIVGELGMIVEPGDVNSLSERIIELIEKGPVLRNQLGIKSRLRIVENFSLKILNKHHEELYSV